MWGGNWNGQGTDAIVIRAGRNNVWNDAANRNQEIQDGAQAYKPMKFEFVAESTRTMIGFYSPVGSCIDIDDVSVKDACSGYTCQCKRGYHGDGKKCLRITKTPTPRPTPRPTPKPTNHPTPAPTPHPCVSGQHDCDKYAGRCMRAVGSLYTCQCKSGFHGNGKKCLKITKAPTPRPTNHPTPKPTNHPTPSPTPAPTNLKGFCPPGTFAYKNIMCKPCPKGTYGRNLGYGHSKCFDCQSGYFSDKTGQHQCKKCYKGTVATADATRCYFPRVCRAGYFNSGDNAYSCSRCPAGTYRANKGANKCLSCPVGYFQGRKGKSYCSMCPVGKYATGGAKRCGRRSITRHCCNPRGKGAKLTSCKAVAKRDNRKKYHNNIVTVKHSVARRRGHRAGLQHVCANVGYRCQCCECSVGAY